ncbi:hypothetical protein MIND_01377200 [Mycena indigotica]|uniref:F-box domain-containing protein n=1 Tax=Mycena indigotica TaxID=2126181 RepID=A0A8H6RY89_9AGAR|nr:uncharacterized protein MIND_01377200 [Mycena indigotica]KAF7289161.1 hypothetical protein MIND_01377200 [Mycena indigotica]
MAIFPAELWEIVFDLLLTDNTLLTLAAVCRQFNTRCIELFLHHRGVSLDAILSANPASLDSDSLTALAIYAPQEDLPFKMLTCVALDSYDCPRLIVCLDNIIRRSPKLHVLSLSFSVDLFGLPAHESQAALAQLCGLISRFANRGKSTTSRKADPVFILTPDTMFTCSVRDVADWKLHNWEFNPPQPRRKLWFEKQKAENLKRSTAPAGTTTRVYSGGIANIPVLHRLISVDVRFIPSSNNFLVVLNPSRIRFLSLNPHAVDIASEQCIQAVLDHALLPEFRFLYLLTVVGLGPTQLHRFLTNHPSTCRITYSMRVATASKSGPKSIFGPPMRHPSLQHLALHIPDHPDPQGHSLIAGLVDSPYLNTLDISFLSYTPNPAVQTDNILGALECLSTSQRQNIQLIMFIHGPRDFSIFQKAARYTTRAGALSELSCAWANEPRGLQLAQRLDCVAKMEVTVLSAPIGRRLLRWCSLLPMLQQIKFRLMIKYLRGVSKRNRLTGQEMGTAREQFLAEAMEALPHVATVLCEVT